MSRAGDSCDWLFAKNPQASDTPTSKIFLTLLCRRTVRVFLHSCNDKLTNKDIFHAEMEEKAVFSLSNMEIQCFLGLELYKKCIHSSFGLSKPLTTRNWMEMFNIFTAFYRPNN